MKQARIWMAWLLTVCLLCGSYGSSVLAAEDGLGVVESEDSIDQEGTADDVEIIDSVVSEDADEILDETGDSVSDDVEDPDSCVSENNVDGADAEEIADVADDSSSILEPEEDMEEMSDSVDMDEWLALNVEERLAEMSSDDDIASGSSGDIAWVIDAAGKLTVMGTGDFAGDTPWYKNGETVISAEVIVTGMTYADGMFYECKNMTSIDLSRFDTSQVTNMNYMFDGCSSLTSIDLSSFDTSRVDSMMGMFGGCSNLANLDLSRFDTSQVTYMNGMFDGCSSLTSIDLSSFDTSQVTYMSIMFDGCSSLTSIDLSSFDTSQVYDMGGMFSGCSNLANLDLSGFDTSQVTYMNGMFDGCSSLTSIDLSSFDTSQVYDMGGMFSGCNSLENLNVSNFDTSKVTSMDLMFEGCWHLTTLDVSRFNTCNVVGMSGMFEDCWRLTSIDLSSFDTSRVDTMCAMFSGCSSLAGLDVSNFNTSKVTDMSFMFRDCFNLANLDLSSFDTSQVTSMSGMFYMMEEGAPSIYVIPKQGVGKLKRLDLSNFDTRQVTNMWGMFFGCESLESLNISSFKTDRVVTMGRMFGRCFNLTTLDLSGFNTDNVTNMDMMFFACEKLENLNVSSFNTSQVTDMRYMFDRCSSLANLDLSSFNTSQVTDMSYMFASCSSLTSLDLSSFDAGKVTNMSVIISGCSSLSKMKTPCHVTQSVMLPVDDNQLWYQPDGTEITEWPKGLDTSLEIVKREKVIVPGENIASGTYGNVTWVIDDNGKLTVDGTGEFADASYGGGSQFRTLWFNYRYFIKTAEINLTDTTNTSYMFYDCKNLESLDMTNFDTSLVTDVNDMFNHCSSLTKINTPCYLRYPVPLPMETGEIWTMPDGTKITELPQNLSYSIIITKNKNKEEEEDPEEKTDYTVTFDLAGHGTEISPITNIESGSLIEAPETPAAEGYIFKGWYKDRSYTKAWDFDTDTIQSDMVLYACWLSAAAGTEVEGVNLCIQEIPSQTYNGSALKPSVIVYSGDGTTLLKAGRDYTIKYYNNIEADKAAEKFLGGSSVTGQDDKTGSGFTKDIAYVVITGKGNYTGVLYQNFHIDAVSISDRDGNLAAGFTLKYTEQLTASDRKTQKPFASIKYRKSMKAGTDYDVKLTALAAYDAEGNTLAKDSLIGESGGQNIIPVIPIGYSGSFLLTVIGKDNGNYAGEIAKTIYISDKDHLMKSAAITLGKNLKTIEYTGENISLTPAYYDADAKKYYAVGSDGIEDREAELDGKDVFTVKIGKEYLRYGKDFSISYTNNRSVGTAAMTITGEGIYVGSKSLTFRIKGTAFNTNNISVDQNSFQTSMPYTGKALTQNHVILKAMAGIKAVTGAQDGSSNELVYGKDYTISYKSNLKKGTAVMTFTANPASGYSGSFKKTFQITAASLDKAVTVIAVADSSEGGKEDSTQKDIITYQDDGSVAFEGQVAYSREGARLTGRIQLKSKSTGAILKEGADYTVSYTNNKIVTDRADADTLPTMTLKGKGSYAGILKVNFNITEAAMNGNKNLTVTPTATAYHANKTDSYQYQPKIKVVDGKKNLRAGNDYDVRYENCTQEKVTAYLNALAAGTDGVTAEVLDHMKPYAVITARKGSGYKEGDSITADLNIYQTKLANSNLYIVVSENAAQTTYTGGQVTPEVTVYYGTSKAVGAAKKAKETREDILTNPSGEYGLIRFKPNTTPDGPGNYTLTYGANVTAGKNKGSVTVIGMGLYGGSVTVKFTIRSKNVYTTK